MVGSVLRRWLGSATIGVLATLVLGVGGVAGSAAATTAAGDPAPLLVLGQKIQTQGPAPSSAFCIATFGIACYSPADLRNQYDFNSAYADGDTGAGQTIVIFDSFGSPTIEQDLATFDDAYGIPAPPSFNIYDPEGKPNYQYFRATPAMVLGNKLLQTELGWANETTLDVEWAHAMAPGANIALVVTNNAESQGVQGVPNLQNAQSWALANHIGTIWSDSWATTEQAFHNTAVVQQLNGFYAQAAAKGVTAFYGTGDAGVSNVDKQGAAYPFPTVEWPSSSPNVITVGGTQISTPQDSLTGYRPEATWNDGYGAGGGGYSTIFPEPPFQAAASIADPTQMRGLPDVSYNSALISSVLIFESFDQGAPPSWVPIGGTSAAAPQWAAVDAIANQADGPLGFLGPRLYQIGENPALYAGAFHDVTSGNDSFNGLTGFPAGTGWDAATGLGTPDVAGLVTALASTHD